MCPKNSNKNEIVTIKSIGQILKYTYIYFFPLVNNVSGRLRKVVKLLVVVVPLLVSEPDNNAVLVESGVVFVSTLELAILAALSSSIPTTMMVM